MKSGTQHITPWPPRARPPRYPASSLPHVPRDVPVPPKGDENWGYGRPYGGTHLVFDAAGLHLVREDLGTGLLRLRFVDVLHQDTLVLEDVTLGLLVKGVVPAPGTRAP